MRIYFISTLLLFFSASALAIDTFDETTNILDIDAVVVDEVRYFNVALRLNAFEVISVGSRPRGETGTEDTFDEATNFLNINAIEVDGVQYFDVVVRLDAFDVISVGSSSPICLDTNLSTPRFNAITENMTLDQVNQTLGCTYTKAKGLQTRGGGYFYEWRVGTIFIDVRFDTEDDGVVTADSRGFFKQRCIQSISCDFGNISP